MMRNILILLGYEYLKENGYQMAKKGVRYLYRLKWKKKGEKKKSLITYKECQDRIVE
jgi:hypothetical protein